MGKASMEKIETKKEDGKEIIVRRYANMVVCGGKVVYREGMENKEKGE